MYSRILVPIDGSAPAQAGLEEAIRIGAATKAKLVVLNVVNEFPILKDPVAHAYYDDLLRALAQAGKDMLARAAQEAAAAGVDCETHVVDASTSRSSDVIVEEIARRGCDLVVMGTHGRRGLKRLTLGSDAELVVRHAAVPVLLVKGRAPAA